jgi:hypothetical protein
VKALNDDFRLYQISFEVHAVGKESSEVKRAYLAGFLDADGAIMASIEKHSEKKYGFRVRVVIKITQKERQILDWMVNEYQVGKVVRNRMTFDRIIKDQQRVEDVLKLADPYLQVKKRQAAYAIEILKRPIESKADLVSVAQLADALSRLNVRSENRRKNYAVMVQEGCLP